MPPYDIKISSKASKAFIETKQSESFINIDRVLMSVSSWIMIVG